ncbi:Peptidase S8 and S53, subtilisin, kexin, sedolisin domain protein [Candidatus Omnitrophus magneticus]|uniref:Peptidase S8 and S53, subtilisin, kexin, sedolisin domain protein n=1 Tax=Candidatus Omnitrophus magneticus TaxID=1609969 RepID=A0A0F0CNP3_9BACT|nr:Peptidase S8 and S53, subtilisin, kexin, sedolisin domain protein [Candidatus Omnitrophus magneticus]
MLMSGRQKNLFCDSANIRRASMRFVILLFFKSFLRFQSIPFFLALLFFVNILSWPVHSEDKNFYYSASHKYTEIENDSLDIYRVKWLNRLSGDISRYNNELHSQIVPSDTYVPEMWHIEDLNLYEAWDISKGDNIVVAVIDTGIDYNHTDLVSQIYINTKEISNNGIDDDLNGCKDDYRGWDFYNWDNNPWDDNASASHGTHVSGIIGASENSSGTIGVAPNVKILPLKVLSSQGSGSFNTISKAIKYAADMGAKILNLSLGGAFSYMPSYFTDAIKYAFDKGSLTIVAAGNSNNEVQKYIPASDRLAFTVGAVDSNNEICYFSNYGYKIDVVAPGQDILSTIRYEDYGYLSGTSMATPMVSGVAALIASRNPNFSPQEIAQKIRFSAVDLGDPGYDKYYGFGLLDAYGALKNKIYSESSGRVLGEWFDTLDEDGFIGYKYYDENFDSRNSGRVYSLWPVDDFSITNLAYINDTDEILLQQDFEYMSTWAFGRGMRYIFLDPILKNLLGEVVEFSTGYSAVKRWFLYGDNVYKTYDNIVVENNQDVWRIYTFNPSGDFYDCANPLNWTYISTITSATAQTLNLPSLEKEDWLNLCLSKAVLPELPSIKQKILETDLNTGLATDVLNYNPYINTIEKYFWDNMTIGNVFVKTYYDKNNNFIFDSSDTYLYGRILENKTDYNLSNSSSWLRLEEYNTVTGITSKYKYWGDTDVSLSTIIFDSQKNKISETGYYRGGKEKYEEIYNETDGEFKGKHVKYYYELEESLDVGTVFRIDNITDNWYRALSLENLSVYTAPKKALNFLTGFNMPWTEAYGFNVGIGTKDVDAGFHEYGWSGESGKFFLDDTLKTMKDSLVRVFIFCDLRSGINFNGTTPMSFTDYVYSDMQALVDTARLYNIKLMPVLLDFTMADGMNNLYEGEHSSCITNEIDRLALTTLLGEFVQYFSAEETIYAWDIMNDPSEIYDKAGISYDEIRLFLKGMVDEIHLRDTDTPVTIGQENREILVKEFSGNKSVGEDIYQYQYFNYMEDHWKYLDFSVDSLGLDKPVMIGALEPNPDENNDKIIDEKLSIIHDNGYIGALAWYSSDPGSKFYIPDEIKEKISNWAYENKRENYESGFTKRVIASNGDIYEYKDEDMLTLDEGLIRLYYNSVKNKYFTYAWDTPSAGRLTVDEYNGVYLISGAEEINSGINQSERAAGYVYSYQNKINTTIFDEFFLLEKYLYLSDGATIQNIFYYSQDSAYRISKIDFTLLDISYVYAYNNEDNGFTMDKVVISTGESLGAIVYSPDEDGCIILDSYSSGADKRIITADGNIIEYSDKEINSFGEETRKVLLFSGSNFYKTFEWSDETVTEKVFTGIYEIYPGAAIFYDVNAEELKTVTIYKHNNNFFPNENQGMWVKLKEENYNNGLWQGSIWYDASGYEVKKIFNTGEAIEYYGNSSGKIKFSWISSERPDKYYKTIEDYDNGILSSWQKIDNTRLEIRTYYVSGSVEYQNFYVKGAGDEWQWVFARKFSDTGESNVWGTFLSYASRQETNAPFVFTIPIKPEKDDEIITSNVLSSQNDLLDSKLSALSENQKEFTGYTITSELNTVVVR